MVCFTYKLAMEGRYWKLVIRQCKSLLNMCVETIKKSVLDAVEKATKHICCLSYMTKSISVPCMWNCLMMALIGMSIVVVYSEINIRIKTILFGPNPQLGAMLSPTLLKLLTARPRSQRMNLLTEAGILPKQYLLPTKIHLPIKIAKTTSMKIRKHYPKIR